MISKEFIAESICLYVAQNEKEYSFLESYLDKLIDAIRNNQSHPLVEVMQIIRDNLESYDNEMFPPIGMMLARLNL